jgi:hypothetical protein
MAVSYHKDRPVVEFPIEMASCAPQGRIGLIPARKRK